MPALEELGTEIQKHSDKLELIDDHVTQLPRMATKPPVQARFLPGQFLWRLAGWVIVIGILMNLLSTLSHYQPEPDSADLPSAARMYNSSATSTASGTR